MSDDNDLSGMFRHNDPNNSRKGARDAVIRKGTQKHKLLQAHLPFETELTPDEAVLKTDINQHSCYWKRISELVQAGLLRDTGEERAGLLSGSDQRVTTITYAGLKDLRRLDGG